MNLYLKNNKYRKYHITSPNLVSNVYFSLIYYLISKITNFHNKKVLDFGGGQGFLKKKLKRKYSCDVKIFDIVNKLSDLKNWKIYNFDIIIFCQVICLLGKKDIKIVFDNLKKRKHILIVSAFSKQTIINKFFAFLLGHKDAHGNTKTLPRTEKKLLIENFNLLKCYNYYFFEILLLKNKLKKKK